MSPKVLANEILSRCFFILYFLLFMPVVCSSVNIINTLLSFILREESSVMGKRTLLISRYRYATDMGSDQ